jgi:hypothetical protein
VANLYVGVYDTVLVVLSAPGRRRALGTRAGTGPPLPPGFRLLLVLLYVVPWLTQPLAQLTGLQSYTLVLLTLGVYLLLRAHYLPAACA